MRYGPAILEANRETKGFARRHAAEKNPGANADRQYRSGESSQYAIWFSSKKNHPPRMKP